jgi:hypothetical protein
MIGGARELLSQHSTAPPTISHGWLQYPAECAIIRVVTGFIVRASNHIARVVTIPSQLVVDIPAFLVMVNWLLTFQLSLPVNWMLTFQLSLS